MIVSGNLIDLHERRIYFSELEVQNGHILAVHDRGLTKDGAHFLMPGFIDAHVHIESSMLVPSSFARMAVCHGTVATVSDPHEIANVSGIEGVEFMLENAAKVPLKIFFGAPSCVPATGFETAGAVIGPDGIRKLLEKDEILYLAEMMNFPGVLASDPDVMEKIRIAKELGLPIDGHAPGLTGHDAVRYINAGISTDHECISFDEAEWKIRNGMKILIREGSAAKNFDALIPLMDTYPGQLMFCSDDKHPDDLLLGHINALATRAIGLGKPVYDVLRAACVNPVLHYRLPVGLLREGDPADFIEVRSLESIDVVKTWINGRLVAENGQPMFPEQDIRLINNFNCKEKTAGDFSSQGKDIETIRVIRAIDGSLFTEKMEAELEAVNGLFEPDLDRDILKIAVVNRYADTKPAVAFIHGFGIHEGAIAGSVAHDSHNIIAVGTSGANIARAVNLIIRNRGGIAAVSGSDELILPLPIGGIMSDRGGKEVAADYSRLDEYVKHVMGSSLKAPFMTLSFMALLVIPALKLSDKGLFDGSQFRFTPLRIAK